MQLHYQLVRILIVGERFEEALEELHVLCDLAPREPPVHTLLGQVCLKLGMTRDAVRHFNAAIELDPKEAVALKVRG